MERVDVRSYEMVVRVKKGDTADAVAGKLRHWLDTLGFEDVRGGTIEILKRFPLFMPIDRIWRPALGKVFPIWNAIVRHTNVLSFDEAELRVVAITQGDGTFELGAAVGGSV